MNIYFEKSIPDGKVVNFIFLTNVPSNLTSKEVYKHNVKIDNCFGLVSDNT